MNSTVIDGGTIAAIIGILVGILALWVPANAPKRTAILRTASVALGAALAVASLIAAPGTHTLADIETALTTGVSIGAGVTVAVAGAKAIPLPSVSLKRSTAAPVVEAKTPAA